MRLDFINVRKGKKVGGERERGREREGGREGERERKRKRRSDQQLL